MRALDELELAARGVRAILLVGVASGIPGGIAGFAGSPAEFRSNLGGIIFDARDNLTAIAPGATPARLMGFQQDC